MPFRLSKQATLALLASGWGFVTHGGRPSSAVEAAAALGPSTGDPRPVPEVFVATYRVTAYCDQGLTAAGVPSGLGQCAAPQHVPFGARVHIPALGKTFIVTDRTSRRFRHNTVDIFMPERQACLDFGREYLECIIELPRETHRYGSELLRSALRELEDAVWAEDP
jgi:3D (Asp-Asp-Asp) domain-containing protein